MDIDEDENRFLSPLKGRKTRGGSWFICLKIEKRTPTTGATNKRQEKGWACNARENADSCSFCFTTWKQAIGVSVFQVRLRLPLLVQHKNKKSSVLNNDPGFYCLDGHHTVVAQESLFASPLSSQESLRPLISVLPFTERSSCSSDWRRRTKLLVQCTAYADERLKSVGILIDISHTPCAPLLPLPSPVSTVYEVLESKWIHSVECKQS